jgi:glutamyl-tRNA reductase
MIVGEGEIAGQVKRAFQEAQDRKQTTSSLQRLFQTAATVSKKVSAETGLGAAGRSIFNSGLELYTSRYGSLTGKSVVVMGTGAYARVIVAALQRVNVGEIHIYSASGRAGLFSESHGTKAVNPQELVARLSQVDLAVTASGGSKPSINFHTAQKLREVRKLPLVVIDVTMGGGVSKSVLELPEFEVFSLEQIRQFAPAEHSEAVLAAQEIVRESVSQFEAEETARVVDPMIAALRSHVSAWVDEEVERVRRKSGNAAAAEVSHSLKRVVNALLHTPSVNAKSLALDGNHGDYISAIKTLFNIDLANELPTGGAHV